MLSIDKGIYLSKRFISLKNILYNQQQYDLQHFEKKKKKFWSLVILYAYVRVEQFLSFLPFHFIPIQSFVRSFDHMWTIKFVFATPGKCSQAFYVSFIFDLYKLFVLYSVLLSPSRSSSKSFWVLGVHPSFNLKLSS